MENEVPRTIHDLPPLVHPAIVRRSPYEWAIMVIGCELALVNFGLGAMLVWGLPTRTNAASFDTIKDLAPMHLWGWLFMVTAVLGIVGQAFMKYSIVTLAHFMAGTAAMFWVIAFVIGLANPNASGTGIYAYVALSLTHWIIAGTTFVGALRGQRGKARP